MLFETYIGLGSNLGNRVSNMMLGLDHIETLAERITVSSLYETSPVGFQGQPRFMNAVCRISTRLNPFTLMAQCKKIESQLGRSRSFPNAPRVIDIDILMHGHTVIHSPWLQIPHKSMVSRAFVLIPLAEIAPNLLHPVFKTSVKQLLEKIPDKNIDVRRFYTDTIKIR